MTRVHALELTRCNKRGHRSEKPAHRRLESSPHSLQLEKAHAQE